MPTSAEDFRHAGDTNFKQQVSALRQAVETALQENRGRQTTCIGVPIPDNTSDDVIKLVAQEYRQQDWRVSTRDNSRDGSYLDFYA